MKQQNVVKKLTILAVLVLAVFGTFLMAKPVRAAESGQVTVTGYRLSVIQLCLAGALFGESGKGKGGTPGFDHGSGITGCCHAAGV